MRQAFSPDCHTGSCRPVRPSVSRTTVPTFLHVAHTRVRQIVCYPPSRAQHKSLEPQIAALKAKLPPGYDVVPGGTVEESAKAQASVIAVFPLMLLLMITLLMIQLQSFQRLF